MTEQVGPGSPAVVPLQQQWSDLHVGAGLSWAVGSLLPPVKLNLIILSLFLSLSLSKMPLLESGHHTKCNVLILSTFGWMDGLHYNC